MMDDMNDMKEVCSHFGEDLNEQHLKNQLSVLSVVVEGFFPFSKSHSGGYS